MNRQMLASALLLAAVLGIGGCSREQSDWEKAHNENNAESYELFVKKYPNGTFTAQAQARLKELYEERDWQKARDADTVEAYQAFLKEHPEGKWTEEARIRVENFNLAQAPSGTPAPASTDSAAGGAGMPPGEAGSAAPPATSAPTAGARAAAAAAAPTTAPTTAPAAPPPPPKRSTAAASTARASKQPPGARSSSGGYVIQLGAFKSGSKAAEQRWAQLDKKYPAVFKGLAHRVRTTKTKTGTLYRLQVTDLTKPAAASVCKRLARHKEPCVILPKAR
jgi:cell division protein FtsN